MNCLNQCEAILPLIFYLKDAVLKDLESLVKKMIVLHLTLRTMTSGWVQNK